MKKTDPKTIPREGTTGADGAAGENRNAGPETDAADSLVCIEVAIPRRHLPALYAFLAARTQPTVVDVPRNGSWTARHLRELAARIDGRAQKFIELVASANGEWVSYQTAADELATPVERLRLDLGRITKHCMAIRQTTLRVWPVESRTADPNAKLGQRYQYRMDPIVAGWWRDATPDDAVPGDVDE
jgi:hypothetical protein